jgi:ubiquitin-conjugating enzyme E2 variant
MNLTTLFFICTLSLLRPTSSFRAIAFKERWTLSAKNTPSLLEDVKRFAVTPQQRVLVGVHFALTSAIGFNALPQLPLSGIRQALKLFLVILASVVAGDFSTGVFHWAVDNYGSKSTPFVGTVCDAFQGHHNEPWTITSRSFVNNVHKIAIGTIPALVLTGCVVPGVYAKLFLVLYINFWLFSQEFHKYAHLRTVTPVLARLQSVGLIVSKKEHGLHHREPFDGHFCILNGMCNPVLDRVHFFRGLEKLVFALTGKAPSRILRHYHFVEKSTIVPVTLTYSSREYPE